MQRMILRELILFFSFFIFSTPALYAQSTVKIELKSGKVVEGTLLEEKDDYIKVSNLGVEMTYWKDEIAKVDKGEGADEDVKGHSLVGQEDLQGAGGSLPTAPKSFNDPRLLSDTKETLDSLNAMLQGMLEGQNPSKRDINFMLKKLSDLESTFNELLQK